MNCGTFYLLKKNTETGEQKPKPVDFPQKSEIETEKCIRCKECNHKLTTPELSIAPFEGTYRNPLGISFQILFYSEASGARDLGNATTVATWFPGYGWSFALCQQCGRHVGWWWSGPERFIGLIATCILH